MRQVGKKSLITVAAASGVIAMTGAYAFADTGASGSASNSPGVASGNTVQVPVSVPVNACGNTVNVVGLLNPASGNRCVNGSGGHGHGGGVGAHGSSSHSPGVVSGNTVQAPVSVPVNACGNSVNIVGVGNPATGNECVNGGGSHHHEWHHGEHHQPPSHPGHHKPPTGHHPSGEKPGHKPPADHHNPADHTQPAHHPADHKSTGVHPAHHAQDTAVKAAHQEATLAAPAAKAVELAHTGAGQLGMAGAASVGLLLGGAIIYRRARSAQN
jgi:ChpA-C